MKIKALILVLFVVLIGCGKGSNVNVVLNGATTNCPANFSCTYNYYEHASVQQNTLIPGASREFSYTAVDSTICTDTRQLYFDFALSSDEFDIKSAQIAAGQAIYFESCPCCNFAFNPEAIGGEIKGKRTDANHWLINATIVIGDANNTPVDTLIVNQTFTLKALPVNGP
jgi:hypothetical protein